MAEDRRGHSLLFWWSAAAVSLAIATGLWLAVPHDHVPTEPAYFFAGLGGLCIVLAACAYARVFPFRDLRRSASPVHEDPHNWEVRCDCGDALLFVLRHVRDSASAFGFFDKLRVHITNPVGQEADAKRAGIRRSPTGAHVQHDPEFLPGFPELPIPGTYHMVWDGRDSQGTWHEIARGLCEFEGLPDGPSAVGVDEASCQPFDMDKVDELRDVARPPLALEVKAPRAGGDVP
jgi:hypothetical protein